MLLVHTSQYTVLHLLQWRQHGDFNSLCCCWLREWFVVFSWGGKTCCPVSLEITYFRLHVPVTLLWCGSPYVSRVVKFQNIGQNIFFQRGVNSMVQMHNSNVSLKITYFRLHVPVTLLWCGSPYVNRVVKFLNKSVTQIMSI